LALSGAIGWTFYVKSRTGSFPPFIQKAITALRGRVAPLPATEGAGNQAAQHQNKDDQNKDKDSPAGERASVQPSPTGSSSAASGSASQKEDETGADASPSSSSPGAAPGSVKPAPASDRSSTASTASAQSSPQNTQPDQAAAGPKKPASEGSAFKVDGFSRRDVPELLRQADAAAGRGDYRLALYEYNLILKLDRGNAAARAGLRRVQAAEANPTQH